MPTKLAIVLAYAKSLCDSRKNFDAVPSFYPVASRPASVGIRQSNLHSAPLHRRLLTRRQLLGCPDLPEGYVSPAPAGYLLYVGAFCQHQSSTLTGQTGSVSPYRHHVSSHPVDPKKARPPPATIRHDSVQSHFCHNTMRCAGKLRFVG